MNSKIPDHTPSVSEEDVLRRRIVLRGALAAGCSLLVPAAFWGCGKKEAETAGTAPPAPEPAAPAIAEPAAPAEPGPETVEPGKVSQASVQYQTQPKGAQKCADCMHFIAESNTCKLVEGEISPSGWCMLWARKA